MDDPASKFIQCHLATIASVMPVNAVIEARIGPDLSLIHILDRLTMRSAAYA